MDIELAKKTIIEARNDLYGKYISTFKEIIKEIGLKKNPFMPTLTIDISEFEIEYNDTATIDEIYYIPECDEVGFLIYKDNEKNTAYEQNMFNTGSLDLLGAVAYCLFSFFRGKKQ